MTKQIAVSRDEILEAAQKLCEFFREEKVEPVVGVCAMMFLANKVSKDIGMRHAKTVLVNKDGEETKSIDGKGDSPLQVIEEAFALEEEANEEHVLH